MATCATCGRESMEGFRFCPFCGAPLPTAEAPRTERKLVTVLFCDLVGFTTRSDRADPEDVRAVLEPFHRIAKAEIERHGGTLDKFIGDAAMGVFGSPQAHEDDAERAVRTGLRILQAIRALNERSAGDPFEVRIGVNTGEAVVGRASGVQVGENVAGDVVNTASRLQAAASPGSVIVGEPTYRATRDAVRYEALDPIMAKGKAEPLRAWRALDIRALPTISERATTSPFVGRQAELAALVEAFEQSLSGPQTHLVVLVGEPGVGKSRLVAEVRSSLRRLAPGGRLGWLRGRCLPYGDGITFWALGEIVKEQAGILDSDPGDERDRKVAEAIEPLTADGSERAWLRSRVAPLVGGEAGEPVERDEAFAAWTRFLQAAALRTPLVAVFEDVHWADPALLAFLEHLTERPEGAPLLVLATARPELADRHPGGLRNARVMPLRPLDARETGTLVSNLFGAPPLPDEQRALVLERSGGNPLYAEEFARALRDRGLTGTGGGAEHRGVVPLPQSLHALIAARLDALTPARKALVQDASVIGRVFWSGAVAFLGDRSEDDVRTDLDELARRELVQPAPVSTMSDQDEYAFLHALIRDVAYGQLPRGARATRHRKAAAWLESVSGDQVADIAEILAYHATTAMDLARAAGDGTAAAEARALAARYLRAAAARTMALDVGKAEEHLRRALDLTPADDPDRPSLLAALGEASLHAGRLDVADALYREAVDGLRRQGAALAAGDAMVRRSVVLEYRGDTAAGREVLSEGIETLRALPPGPELARALATSAGRFLVAGRYPDAIVEADRAIELADRVGEVAAAARVHGFRGYARAIQGDRDGIEEQRRSLAGLRALGQGRAAAIAANNLGSCLSHAEGAQAGLDVLREGLAFAEARGLREVASALRSSMVTVLFEVGEWDELLRLSQLVVEEARAQGQGYDEIFAEADQALVRACREGAGAIPFCESVLERARPMEDLPMVLQALLAAATSHAAAGDREAVRTLVAEAVTATDEDVVVRAPELAILVRLAAGAGDLELAERALAGSEDLVLARYRLSRLAGRAVVEEARSEQSAALERYEEAARRWTEHGHAFERAHALFGAGRCLAAIGRADEARRRLDAAAAGFEALGARPSLDAVRAVRV